MYAESCCSVACVFIELHTCHGCVCYRLWLLSSMFHFSITWFLIVGFSLVDVYSCAWYVCSVFVHHVRCILIWFLASRAQTQAVVCASFGIVGIDTMPRHPKLSFNDVGFAYFAPSPPLPFSEKPAIKLWKPVKSEYLWELWIYNEALML